MTDIPIIFSALMVRALLDGRKTMTRRLAWRSKALKRGPNKFGQDEDEVIAHHITPSPWQKVKPSDRLWVREAWRTHQDHDSVRPRDLLDGSRVVVVSYEADADRHDRLGKERRSFHMPRWASRLTLTVTATKIERLQEMSAPDAIAEGIEMESADPPFYYVPGIWPHSITAVGIEEPGRIPHAVRSFAKLWTHLHGAESWDANPEVVALTFTVAKQNIDNMEKAA